MTVTHAAKLQPTHVHIHTNAQDETLGPDLEQPTLLGVAKFLMDCLYGDIPQEYNAPIVASTGTVSCHHLLYSLLN